MTKSRFLHYLKLAVEAFFLLNFSTIFIMCLFGLFGAIFSGGGVFQRIVLGMMFEEVSSSWLIIGIRILLFISSVYLWFKQQNWLTAAYLIIAGTAAGLLGIYFFAFFPFSLLGCMGVLAFCASCSLLWRALRRRMATPKFHNFRMAWKQFWTPLKISLACALCALVLFIRFIPWEFPFFGKPLPYGQSGFMWRGGLPPHEYTITITVDMQNSNASMADVAATCAAANRYFLENYGFPALTIHILGLIDGKEDKCFYMLGRCTSTPAGLHLYEREGDFEPVWDQFEVARDYPVETIRKANRLVEIAEKANMNVGERDRFMSGKTRNWEYGQLQPDFQKVITSLLPADLCEAPEPRKLWSMTISREKLVAACEIIYLDLKKLGTKPNFPLCYEKGCDDVQYLAWARQKFRLWEERDGNFVPEINPFNTALDALTRAFASRDSVAIASLSAKIEDILRDLKACKACPQP